MLSTLKSPLAPLLAGLLLLLPACTGTGRARHNFNPDHAPTRTSEQPAWADQANSWAKLESINAWLETQGPRSDDFWRIEGRLQLAEGRMEFYRSEMDSIDAGQSRQRLGAARADFLRVHSDPSSSESQIRRAHRGLQGASSTPASMPRV